MSVLDTRQRPATTAQYPHGGDAQNFSKREMLTEYRGTVIVYSGRDWPGK